MDFSPLQFDEPIPLFPLPNCVLFPGVVQPLHIFEPRYRDMMEFTLDHQSAIAMSLLLPGWEKSYYGSPAIHPVVCVGKIVAHERLSDGKFNLLLHGITRARLRQERKHGLFRTGMLEPLHDLHLPSTGHEKLQRRVLRELFEKTALKDLTVSSTLASLFSDCGCDGDDPEIPLSRLLDSLAFTLVQDVARKQELLEELDPLKRGEKLLQDLVALACRLERQAKPSHAPAHWPPAINAN